MEQFVIAAVILAAFLAGAKFFSKNDKKPSGNCRNCPEYRYCGGGRPRCARRNEMK